MKSAEKNSAFELLRIICIFGIVSMHTWGPVRGEANSINAIIIVLINSLFNMCVSLFVLISGYYGIQTERNPKKIVDVWLQVLFCSIVSYVIVNLISSNWSVKELINACLPVTRGVYWYASSYVLLMLLAPFLNKAAQSLSRVAFRRLLIILISAFSFIPTVVFHHFLNDGGKGPANVLLMYLIGRYIRLYYEESNNKKKYAVVAVVLITVQFFGNLVATYIWRNVLERGKIYCPLAEDYSILIVAGSIAIFMWFKSLRFHSDVINWIARRTFTVDLMDEVVRGFLTSYMDVYHYVTEPYFVIYVCGIVLLTMVIGGAFDILRVPICSICSKVVDKIVRAIKNKMESLFNRL